MLFWLLLFIVGFTILAINKMDWALLVLIAALPAYLIRFKILGIPLTLLEAMILVSFGVWFIKDFVPGAKDLIKNHKLREAYPFSWEIILLLIISFVAVGVAGFTAGSLGIWKAYFFEPVLLFILIVNNFQTKEKLVKIFWAFAVSAGIVSLFAIFQKITGLFITNPFWSAAATRRVVSFFGYPNAVGLYLAPLTMIFITWLFSFSWKKILDHWPEKTIIALTAVISLLAIYFARSEGALIGIFAGLAVLGILAGKRQRLAVLSLAVVVIAGVFFFAPTKNFVLTKLMLHDLSGEIRQQQWKETISMLKDGKIISGAGLDNYQAAVKPYHQEGIFFNSDNLPNFDSQVYGSSTLRAKYWQPTEIYMYPHNIFLNFWSELGLAGLMLFAWLIGKYFVISFKLSTSLGKDDKTEKYLALGLLTAMVAIFVQGLVDVPYFKNDLSAMFWILCALVGILNRNHEKKLI